jgi:hypothetical protein
LEWLTDEQCRAILATQTMLIDRLAGCDPNDGTQGLVNEAAGWEERSERLWSIGYMVDDAKLATIEDHGGLVRCIVLAQGGQIIDTQHAEDRLTADERAALAEAVKIALGHGFAYGPPMEEQQ